MKPAPGGREVVSCSRCVALVEPDQTEGIDLDPMRHSDSAGAMIRVEPGHGLLHARAPGIGERVVAGHD